MKYLNRYCIVFLVMILCSCEKFLEEKPKDTRASTTSYQNESDFKSGLMGVYEAYYSLYQGLVTPLIGQMGTDEVIAGFNQTNLLTLDQYTLSASDTYCLPDWYKFHYNCINRANVLISRAKDYESSGEVSRTAAEAKVLRAWCYFRLAQTFGPVVLVVDETVAPVDYNMPREPLNEVYARIVRDLTEAINSNTLPKSKDANAPVRFNEWAVKAMLGKVYLTMASAKEAGIIDKLMERAGKQGYGYGAIPESVTDLYRSAKETLNDIIQNAGINLEPDYRKLFVETYKNACAENMWELQANDGLGTSNPGKGFQFYWRYGASGGGNANPVLNGNFTNHIKFHAAMLVRAGGGFQEEDVRKAWCLNGGYMHPTNPAAGRQYLFLNYNYGTGILGFANMTLEQQEVRALAGDCFYAGITKFRHFIDLMHVETKYTDRTSLPLNFTVIRYADVLLMYAEACFKLNNNTADSEAIAAMNRVRSRSRDGSPESLITMPDYDANMTFRDILDERKRELGFELIRWFDLSRTGQLIDVLNDPATYMSGGQQIRPKLTDERVYLYPIPQGQMDTSSNKEGFFQNPGY